MESTGTALGHIGLRATVETYLSRPSIHPLFLCGEALEVLRDLPSERVDFCMTSPPYWGHRQYGALGMGLEDDYKHYISALIEITGQVARILKRGGSFWLNLGDAYVDKRLLGIPWRVALELMDKQGWILRNSVVWHKVKGGPDNAKDKLRNVHEDIFHFVKSTRHYYNAEAIRSTPRTARVVNGRWCLRPVYRECVISGKFSFRRP